MEMVIENGDLPSRKKLGEQLQNEYPGAVVQNIYPSTPKGTVTITSSKHYNHGTLSWIDEDWQSSSKTARDPDSRINKALRRWNCR